MGSFDDFISEEALVRIVQLVANDAMSEGETACGEPGMMQQVYAVRAVRAVRGVRALCLRALVRSCVSACVRVDVLVPGGRVVTVAVGVCE